MESLRGRWRKPTGVRQPHSSWHNFRQRGRRNGCQHSGEGEERRISCEQTWKKLVLELVIKGEREELVRFQKIGVYEQVSLEDVGQDPEGEKVIVKLVGNNKGSDEHREVRCRLVAQELGWASFWLGHRA